MFLAFYSAVASVAPCWQFSDSDIGGGVNMPFAPCAQAQLTETECCACCRATPGCASWTLARPSSIAEKGKCWHHPAGSGGTRPHANWTAGLCSSTQPSPPKPVDSYDWLHLHNHAGPSGVPLGGIGVGFFSITPQGRIGGVAINNWHRWGLIDQVNGSFIAGWSEARGAQLLQSDAAEEAPVLQDCAAPAPSTGSSRFGMPFANDTHSTMLFPTANITIDDGQDYAVRAWSGLVPHAPKDSSLPLAWIEVTLRNPTAQRRAMAAAFSWQDVIARQTIDVTMEQLNSAWPKSAPTRREAERAAAAAQRARADARASWGVSGVDASRRRVLELPLEGNPPPQPPPPAYNGAGCGGNAHTMYNNLINSGDNTFWNGIARRATFARSLNVTGLRCVEFMYRYILCEFCSQFDSLPLIYFNLNGLSGLVQRCDPITPVKATLQNYNDQLALLVDTTTIEEGDELTFAPSFRAHDGVATGDGADAWASFRASGRLRQSAAAVASRSADVPLYVPSSSATAPEMASAVALRTTVAPMSSRVVRFAVAWHAPELVVDKVRDLNCRDSCSCESFSPFDLLPPHASSWPSRSQSRRKTTARTVRVRRRTTVASTTTFLATISARC